IEQQETFEVDERTLKVVSALFYMPSTKTRPGAVTFADFLHLMSTVGFEAEKLYGSAWVFVPKGLDLHRNIQFHEPHPVSKLPFKIARRWGRRLRNAYGWHGGMFEL
ncbi:hypothetical protein BDY21DRAFT_264540, partial [Lineolata rhizophorae]